ncbi:uncharacterized protein MELLADRAFT_90237 [Melampsora larici-populina 98AG31]|uniref:CxC5 like cysteine cluster associated with KDZ domain-containing protein n=1 Tax=Melampsora larici-populina (strain 98AG31 / pathotype 3-4-7) TaxID=747676 RepID=F4RW76_MELLP|nr:uncharacterized protein MELLADRAFT_90237 [Melampsora larici-populina 98AG31]EGG03369.1 hypothetical protein MELLADRAFT_90237 [Melampsora larici-populina 98AG31]
MLLATFINIVSSDCPELLTTITISDVIRFASLAAEIYTRTEGAWNMTLDSADDVIPFLRTALNSSLPTKAFRHLWRILFPTLSQIHIRPANLIQQHGYQSGLPESIPEFFLTPPVKKCLVCANPSTPEIRLQHRSQIDGYVYDVDGVHTARIYTMKCPKCTTHYRPSYYSEDGTRTYYSSLIGRNQVAYQVSTHFFMTHQLAELFLNGQMLAHISNFNLVNMFNLSYVNDVTDIPRLNGAPTVQPFISESTCRDALDIHCLLNRADACFGNLIVDTKTTASDQRYHDPMQQVLEWIALEGTKHRDHVCSACVQLTSETAENGNEGYIRAVVTDGVTIGHWRCTATADQLRELAVSDGLPPPNGPCTTPLARVHDCFCPNHQLRLGRRCHAQPCSQDAENGSATCGLQEHVDAYARFKARVKW